jgi:hypothetical protein
MNRRPLSRSLIPLDDESLAGFLLRLAKYTGCSPAVIADRMGLGQYYRAAIPVGSLLTLSSEQLAECAHVARLSHAEWRAFSSLPWGGATARSTTSSGPGPALNNSPTRGAGSISGTPSSAHDA